MRKDKVALGTDIFIFKNSPKNTIGRGYTIEIFENGVKIYEEFARTKEDAFKYVKLYKDKYRTNRAFQNQLGLHVTYKTKKDRSIAMNEIDAILYKKAQYIEELLKRAVHPELPVKKYATSVGASPIPIPSSLEEQTLDEDAITQKIFQSLVNYFKTTEDNEVTQYNEVKSWLADRKKDLKEAIRIGYDYDLKSIANKLKELFRKENVPGKDIVFKRAWLDTTQSLSAPQQKLDLKSLDLHTPKLHSVEDLKSLTNKLKDTPVTLDIIDKAIDTSFTEDQLETLKSTLNNKKDKNESEYLLLEEIIPEHLKDYHESVMSKVEEFYKYASMYPDSNLDTVFLIWKKENNINDKLATHAWYTIITTLNCVKTYKQANLKPIPVKNDAFSLIAYPILNQLYKIAEATYDNFKVYYENEITKFIDVLADIAKKISYTGTGRAYDLNNAIDEKSVKTNSMKVISSNTITNAVNRLVDDMITYSLAYSASSVIENNFSKLYNSGYKSTKSLLDYIKENFARFKQDALSSGGITNVGNVLFSLLNTQAKQVLSGLPENEKQVFIILLNSLFSVLHNVLRDKLSKGYESYLQSEAFDKLVLDSINKLLEKSAQTASASLKGDKSKASSVVVEPDGTVIVDPENEPTNDKLLKTMEPSATPTIIEPSNSAQTNVESDQTALSPNDNVEEKEVEQEVEKVEESGKEEENNSPQDTKKEETTLLDILWM